MYILVETKRHNAFSTAVEFSWVKYIKEEHACRKKNITKICMDFSRGCR